VSEEKPSLPKMEMPKLSQEFLDQWAVSMEAMGEACRQFADAVRAAFPSVQKHVDAAVKATKPRGSDDHG
jgi:hypothetical protein